MEIEVAERCVVVDILGVVQLLFQFARGGISVKIITHKAEIYQVVGLGTIVHVTAIDDLHIYRAVLVHTIIRSVFTHLKH